jgi:hypothetical protein
MLPMQRLSLNTMVRFVSVVHSCPITPVFIRGDYNGIHPVAAQHYVSHADQISSNIDDAFDYKSATLHHCFNPITALQKKKLQCIPGSS